MERKPYSGTERRSSVRPRPESASPSRSSVHSRSSNSYRSASRSAGASSDTRRASSDARRVSSDARRASSDSRRYASASASRAGASARPAVQREPQREPARRKPEFNLNRSTIIRFAILAAVLALLIYVGSAWITTAVNRGTFCTGVYVNNIHLTNYSLENGKAYIQSLIDAQMNTSYTLTGAGHSYTFSTSDLCTAEDTDSVLERAWNIGHVGSIFDCSRAIKQVKAAPLSFNVEIKKNEAAFDAFVDQICSDIYIAPVDAQVVVDLNAPRLTGQSSIGREVDREALCEQLERLLKTGDAPLELPVVELQPTITSGQASSALDLIVEFSTDVSFRGYNSRYNVRKALSYFNGLCVHPDETIDFNEVVGERTENNGWMEATEYAANDTAKGYGGGVCQASSTLYNAVIRALGYESIIRRDAHSMTVTYLDPSLDAAVTNTNRDFIFKNVSENPIYIYTEVTKKEATVRIFGVRPEYRYDLESVLLKKDKKAARKGYIYDTEGTYCFYVTDMPVLYKEGIPACSSQSWIIAYDWETGSEVWRKQLANDHYESGTDIYWVGIHNPDGSIIQQAGVTE